MSQQGSGGNVIAALCNVFIPGLGQLIQGRILAAIFFFVFYAVAWVLIWVAIGWLLVPIAWLWAVIDAARFKPGG